MSKPDAGDPTHEVLVLASASPRRRDLLTREGVAFEVVPADIDEHHHAGESPEALVQRLAYEKASAVAQRIGPGRERWVLGSDTVVVLDGDVLGKPRDPAHARALLGRLTGHTHRVMTGYAFVSTLAAGDRTAAHVAMQTSQVAMREASEEEIAAYVETGEPMDKAGAYAVQGRGARFVTDVAGSQDNVIGLPVDEVCRLWSKLRASGGEAAR